MMGGYRSLGSANLFTDRVTNKRDNAHLLLGRMWPTTTSLLSLAPNKKDEEATPPLLHSMSFLPQNT